MMLELRYLDPEEVVRALGELNITIPAPKVPEYTRYLAAFNGHDIVGVTILNEHPEMSNIHIEYLEVPEAARHHGVASAMLERVFVEAADKAKTVTNNGFSDMGMEHLIHVQNRLAEKHGVSQAAVGRC